MINAEKIEKSQHFTKPVANFTEASLVKKLEENGIGRPSTYASIINSLTSRFYIVIESKKIIPTDLGKNVNKFLVSNFERIINEKFTMEMEEKLDEIAENKKDWKKVISEFYAFFETFLKKSEEDLENYKIQDLSLIHIYSLIRTVSMVIGLFYGAFLIRSGDISIGKLVAFFGLCDFLAWSFWGLGDCINCLLYTSRCV